MIDSSISPAALITSSYQKIPKVQKKTIDVLLCCLKSKKFMKNSCIKRPQISLGIFSPNFNVIFDRKLLHNTAF